MRIKRIKLLLLFSLFIFHGVYPQDDHSQYNCLSILVCKEATVDGSMLFAHNEDDPGINLVNWYKVPRLSHQKGENISLINNGQIPQVDETFSLLWLEMPGQTFSDSYMNEWGVTITSNACQSKEETPDLIDDGIGYYLRRIMAERAKTAKEAVKIGGLIVDSIGYAGSGRTYCIADPNEAWMMSIVQGKHWVAEKIPDDHISIIPNYYTIQEVDLTDTLNFLGSPDIVDYAIKRGWYDPESGNNFNFRLAYGKPSEINSVRNMARNWGATNLLSAIEYDISDDFPFSFKPKEKVSIQDLMNVLKYHYEDTKLEDKTISSPHDYDILPICRKDTQYGMIAQLRNWLPIDIGSVLWLAPHRPCSQVFIPWYFGITKIPPEFNMGDYNSSLENHFNKYDDIISETSIHNFWDYANYSEEVDKNYYELIPIIKENKQVVQRRVFEEYNNFDKNILDLYEKSPQSASDSINIFTTKMLHKSLNYMDLNKQKGGNDETTNKKGIF
ncbi:MAG: C69 family dipeptidase [Candidatus Neomarinimicrobiota bacterium]